MIPTHDSNTDLQLTNTNVEINCAPRVSVTWCGGCINGSDRHLMRDMCVCTDSECHWAGTHFGRLCWLVHGSGRVCPVSGGSQSQAIWHRFWEPAFISGIPRPASLSLRELSSQALTLLGRARFITWCLKHNFGGNADRARGIFVLARHVLAMTLCLDPPKTGLCATLFWSVGHTTNTDKCICKIEVKSNIISQYYSIRNITKQSI